MKYEKNFYIPVYVINLKKRKKRKEHIRKEFEGKNEFKITFIEACEHEIGRIGLWQSIVQSIETAKKNKDDVIIICEDDHLFTENYSKEILFETIIKSNKQGVELLSGGIGGFGVAVPIDRNRYWIDWFWCTQFIVVFSSFFNKILEYQFKDDDTADGVFSLLTNKKMVIYPFISIQKDFGYSDVTNGNNEIEGLITQYFMNADRRLSQIYLVNQSYNYKK